MLYVGLALTPDGPKVIEFNARFGDPETQVVLALLETPLGGLLHAAATGTLAEHPPLRWHDGAAVTVVVASAELPGHAAYRRCDRGRRACPGVIHAGTARREDGALVSAGGRVLSVTAAGAGPRGGPGRGVRAGRRRAPGRRPVPHRHRPRAVDGRITL